jgi:hypothetical protein
MELIHQLPRHMHEVFPPPTHKQPGAFRRCGCERFTMMKRKLTLAASAIFTILHAGGVATAASEAEKVAAQLEQIYDAAKNSQDREVVAAASVLSTLIGALQSHRTLELSDFVLPFSQSEVDRLQEEIRSRRGL